MVVTNHPLASLAGTQVLLEGGNAVDAAIACLFALSVVEPMMVGPLGGGVAHIRMADGRHTILDGLSAAPAAATADLFQPRPGRRQRDRGRSPSPCRARWRPGVRRWSASARHPWPT